jgi:hypothetical protein
VLVRIGDALGYKILQERWWWRHHQACGRHHCHADPFHQHLASGGDTKAGRPEQESGETRQNDRFTAWFRRKVYVL